jgi:drug/metabolite transporter (DMT)-like permease
VAPLTTAQFLLTALLWGGGALMTAFQAGIVPAPVSVAYRMTLVGGILLLAGHLTGARLRLSLKDAVWVALQGVSFFGVAFIGFYQASRLIPSGLAALILSMSSLLAAILGRIFLGASLSLRAILGLICGGLGLAIVVGPDLLGVVANAPAVAGPAWALLAAAATAIGTVVGARNQRQGVPALAVLGWGALVGGAFACAWSIAAGLRFTVDTSLRYAASFSYLVVFASCAAFLLYFDLVRRIGPARTSYTLALVPVIALALSALFEGLALDTHVLLGAAVILLGNVLVLSR